MSEQESKPVSTTEEPDPAEFLISNSKYHDCYLVVGNPANDEVETIGVSSAHLIAYSPVFRDMLDNNKLVDPSKANIHITDVSPATFKLMLRHVYGGELPKLDDKEIMELGNVGARYKIHHLAEQVGKQMKLVSAEDVFAALKFAARFPCPALELEVDEVIQKSTERIVCDDQFLELDEDSMVLIAKQDKLSISELQLWNHLVEWGQNQVQQIPEKSLRVCLRKVLRYFRVLSLTVEEIVEHVLPIGVFAPDESEDLILAVAMGASLLSPGLCANREVRQLYYKSVWVFDQDSTGNFLKKQGGKCHSSFSIRPKVQVRIDYFTIKNQECKPNSNITPDYQLNCTIAIVKSVKGHLVVKQEVQINSVALFHNNVILPIKLEGGKPLVLKAPGKYIFYISFSTPHTVYEIYENEESVSEDIRQVEKVDITFKDFDAEENMTVKYEDYPHVIGIGYATP